MKSALQDLYGESALQQELVLSSPSDAAGPKVDDKEDISDGEFVTGFNTGTDSN